MSLLHTTDTMQSCVVHVMRSVAVSSRKSSISARIRRGDMAMRDLDGCTALGDSASTTIAFPLGSSCSTSFNFLQSILMFWELWFPPSQRSDNKLRARQSLQGQCYSMATFRETTHTRFEPSQPTGRHCQGEGGGSLGIGGGNLKKKNESGMTLVMLVKQS